MSLVTIDKHRWRRAASILIAGVALLNAGCYKATGGGWIPTSITFPTGGDRASFGFSAMCKTTTMADGSPGAGLYDGQLEWHDGIVRLHGDVEPFDFIVLPGRCQDVRSMLVGKTMEFGGSYRPQTGGESGFFTVTVMDNGTPGANGDFIQIQLVGGEFNTYEDLGTLQGGNIQVF
jgi:hypothetical protein